MKANELTIGDWVSLPNCEHIKVDAVHRRKIGVHHRKDKLQWYFEDKVKPIPLTEDILLVNGFEKEKGAVEDVLTYDNEDENVRLVIHPKETNYTRGCYTYINIERGCISIDELPIMYVHELQHALRMCELADTVKIELGN